MSANFQLINTPTVVDIGEWICENIGYIAVGKKLSDSSKVQLLAIEKANTASVKLKNFAKKHNALVLTSISEGEVNAID